MILWTTDKCTRIKDNKSSWKGAGMADRTDYYVVKKKALPEVLLSVVEAKRLLETRKVSNVQEAVDAVGISRSSFYKYKDDIFRFHDIGTLLNPSFLTLSCTSLLFLKISSSELPSTPCNNVRKTSPSSQPNR